MVRYDFSINFTDFVLCINKDGTPEVQQISTLTKEAN